ncbi:unnamed protein product [Chironomus riparius]|uniref:ADP-ribosylation factor-like protein 6-interacting protein 4 n=1 Tax=Chironomus riparius TaxID=315576 RepID=A0A9N9WUI8_9DIPT|nr:unnamed protein product [Chironomus riparius]
MNSFKKKSKKIKKKRDKKGKKDKKRSRRSSSSSSSSSSDSSLMSTSSSSSDSNKHKQKKRKHKKDHKRKKARRYEDKSKDGESSKSQIIIPVLDNQPKSEEDNDFTIPLHLMDNNHKKPETKEEYEKRQSILRRVVDEETGRTRLIKGDGEIIEEMVTRDRHKEINRQATQGDGQSYQNKMIGWAVTSNKK